MILTLLIINLLQVVYSCYNRLHLKIYDPIQTLSIYLSSYILKRISHHPAQTESTARTQAERTERQTPGADLQS